MKISAALFTTIFGFATCSDKVIVGYYVPWGNVRPEEINYKKVTHINYGFGVLQDKTGIEPTHIELDQYYDINKIKTLKELASKNGVKVLISLVRDSNLRRKFIQEAIKLLSVNTNERWEKPNGLDLDGIDLDWEYPNRKTTECNTYHKDDTANYLVLLKELRDAMTKKFPNEHKLLTAAVRVEPFDDAAGKPSSDVSKFAEYFDFINIMTYDIMGAFSKTSGANAPFRADISKGGDRYSFTQGIESWLNAGFPANKITAGLAFYGRSMTTNVDMNNNTMYVTKSSITPKGDQSDSNKPNSFCNEGEVYSGVYKYKYLRQDILKSDYAHATGGFIRYFDKVTQTPWLFNPSSKMFISYDDPQSIKVKVDYIKQKKILGAMFWELSQDYKDELLDVVNQLRIDGPSTTTNDSPNENYVPSSLSSKKDSIQPSQTNDQAESASNSQNYLKPSSTSSQGGNPKKCREAK